MQKQNIFLIGPMGAGKSTVGRFLAQRLGYSFLDSDHEIEARTGVTIPMIFDIEGEAGFRDREVLAIDELTQQSNLVLATGGGAVLREENRRALRSRGYVVYLRASVESLIQRTKSDRNRPLLQTDNPEQVIRELLETRDPIYMELADFVVETQQVSIYRVVKYIHETLESKGVV